MCTHRAVSSRICFIPILDNLYCLSSKQIAVNQFLRSSQKGLLICPCCFFSTPLHSHLAQKYRSTLKAGALFISLSTSTEQSSYVLSTSIKTHHEDRYARIMTFIHILSHLQYSPFWAIVRDKKNVGIDIDDWDKKKKKETYKHVCRTYWKKCD